MSHGVLNFTTLLKAPLNRFGILYTDYYEPKCHLLLVWTVLSFNVCHETFSLFVISRFFIQFLINHFLFTVCHVSCTDFSLTWLPCVNFVPHCWSLTLSSFTVCLEPFHHSMFVLNRFIIHCLSWTLSSFTVCLEPFHHSMFVLNRFIIHCLSWT